MLHMLELTLDIQTFGIYLFRYDMVRIRVTVNDSEIISLTLTE